MEISVQGTHEETVQPEIGRLHASAQAEAAGKDEVLRTATAVVQRLQAELTRLQEAGQVSRIVVRPISTSSWRPVARGRQQPPIYRAHAEVRADFTDFAALADLAAHLGAMEGLELNRVEWRLTDATRRELENTCLTRRSNRPGTGRWRWPARRARARSPSSSSPTPVCSGNARRRRRSLPCPGAR